jgi:beta-mannosidase
MIRRANLDWKVGHAPSAEAEPERWVPAAVPGAVQLDWARAEGWPPYWSGGNFASYRWMEDVFWTYRAQVGGVACSGDERLIFVCGGVDYRFAVLWEGQVIHEQEGMFTPFEIDLTNRAQQGGRLEIRLHPAPKAPSGKDDHSQARLSVKPAVAYGWDWHPRLIPLGIWQDTCLEIRPSAHFRNCEITYSLDPALRTANLKVTAAVSPQADGREWRWALAAPSGAVVIGGQGRSGGGAGQDTAMLADPELWWPHDHGPQPLYRATFELLGPSGQAVDRRVERVGFRRVKLVMNEGTWGWPSSFPKSRCPTPITIEINGRPVFARGTNWVPPDIFPGTISTATYHSLLTLVHDAHLNLIRSWGGGIVNKEAFFDRCDELGLLVWQEFPLACNLYEDDPAYLRVLDTESRSIIQRLRRHPCLAMWCGGNELFNSWSGMTDQSLALRILNRNCLDLDPATPFIPTAPLEGMGHGDYRFRDERGQEVHQIFSTARNTAYSEFGCPGPSSVEYLKRFIPESELWPPRPGASWQIHHAFGAWGAEPTSWLFLDVLRHYFGEPASLEALVSQGQWLQAEGYKVIFEEARRQKPACSMALNWCFNEPWPSAANNSIVNWPAEPKPAYHAIAASCRPVMASARIPKFSWREGEDFEAELWLLNDSYETIPAGRMGAIIVVGDVKTNVFEWEHPAAGPNRHVRGPVMRWRLPPPGSADRFTLGLLVDGMLERGSAYTMPLKPVDEARAAKGHSDAS